MRKLFMAALLIACAAPLAFSQTTSSSDYNKYDFGVLYSHDRVDAGLNDQGQNFITRREGFNGVEGFGKYNFSRYVGAVADYSFHRKTFNDTFGTTVGNVRVDLNTLMGGVEIKDNNAETKVKPFARGLVGFQHANAHLNASDTVCIQVVGVTCNNFDESDNGFSAAIGGGVDFRLNSRVDVRAIQFDYNPTHFSGETQHNFRFGVGLIFR
jgi:opacity protein-like surface antigen